MEAIDLKRLRKNLFGLQTSKVSRSLFGEVNHEEIKKDLEREYNDLLQEKSKLWNFDFDKYEPKTEMATTSQTTTTERSTSPTKKNTTSTTPRDLTWIPYRSSNTFHCIEKNKSLVTATSQDFTTVQYCSRVDDILNRNASTTTVRSTTNTRQQQINSPQKTFGEETALRTSTRNSNKKGPFLILSKEHDEDENAIKIINESPIRNISATALAAAKERNSPAQESRAKLDITKTLSRKRKRGSQPTIDGKYMRKKLSFSFKHYPASTIQSF